MTDILCRWLNEDVRVAPKLSDGNFAQQFSSGYLFGEVLSKHGLQEDFAHFSRGTSSEAKLNNFMRLEPTFTMLEVPFNINMARDVMTEKPGAAMRVLYQLFVALNRNKKRELSGQCMEFTRSPGRLKLEKVETSIFQERLKHQTPRQVDLNFEELIDKFKERQRMHEDSVMRERQRQGERLRQEQRENCHKALERGREARDKQNLMYSKLNPLSPSKTTSKTPGSTGRKGAVDGAEWQARQQRRAAVRAVLAEETRDNIDSFEARLKTTPTSGAQPPSPQHTATSAPPTTGNAGSSGDYVGQIKRRVQDWETGRKEREKRRRRVLVQQMTSLQEQEEERREQQLVERLMRQCQQESRIATQLMHIRKQKDTIRNNRIFRQKQFEEQRMKEFQEALDREAELSKQSERERKAREAHNLTLYRQHQAVQADLNYRKHYQMVSVIMSQIVDFTTKMAEYRDLTDNMVPAKVAHDWKTLFISGQPLYPADGEGEEGEEGEGDSGSRMSQSLCSMPQSNAVRDNLLDETDFWQYRNVQVDWVVSEAVKAGLPEPHCSILTHMVYSLLDQVDPPQPPPSPPHFPKFHLRASLVGKPFSGKTTVLTQLSHQMGITVLSPSHLVQQVVQQYLSERQALEAQMISSSQEGENPLTSSNTEGDIALDNGGEGSEKADEAGISPVGNGAANDGENPLVKEGTEGAEDGEVTATTSGMNNDGAGGNAHEGKKGEQEGAESITEDLPPYFSELSVLGALGCRAHLSLCRGEQVNDSLTVTIIVEKLRCLPNGSSWVLDNFPTTLDQAKLLSRSLTGEQKTQPRFSRDFLLIPEHHRKHLELQAAAGLDLVVHLATPSEAVLLRAAEQCDPGQDSKLDHVQHRLLMFEASWPRLNRWLQKFRILTSISTAQDPETVASAVNSKMKDIINKTKQNEAMLKLGVVKRLNQLSSGSTTSLPMLHKHYTTISQSPLVSTGKKKKGRVRRPSSAGAPHPLHAVLQAEKQVEAAGDGSVEPGAGGWEYCSLPVAAEMAEGLAGKWGEVERCYVAALKAVFRRLRWEREAICRYFHKRKTEFAEYLRRPDHKQELVSQWQDDFNSLAVHLRREASVKAEQHCKVDDLCDRLWDICDVSRGEWEAERARVMAEHWVEDHLGLLANTYISLMQAELVKFQEALLLIQDYYSSMQGATPPQLPTPARVPLIELVSTGPQDPPSSSTDLSTEQPARTSSSGPVRKKSSKFPLLPRQPPPVPSSDDKSGAGGKKKDKGAMEETSTQPPLEDMTGLELDQQLIVHTYNTALTTVHSAVYPVVHSLESSIETTMAVLHPPTSPARQQASGGHTEEEKKPAGKPGKGGKDKGGKGSPPKKTPAKKGAQDPVPLAEPATPSQMSAAEREKKEQLIRAWREQKAAIQDQELSMNRRLNLIKTKAVDMVTYLKSIAAKTYADMETWVGQNYTQEVDCVAQLSGILRQAVEEENPLSHELMIPGKTFYIEGSVMLFEEAPPLSPPTPLETPPPAAFSVAQLRSLLTQLSDIAPEGFMLAHTFVDTLYGFTDNTCGEYLLPDSWYGLSKEQVQRVCDELYGKEADYVDWKHFLVCVAQPWPVPSPQQLVAALQSLHSVMGRGRQASRQQYMAVQTWLEDGEGDEEREGGTRFNRVEKLREFIFDLFSDKDEKLDYTNMLLYLCVDSSPELGLSKALSVAVGREISLKEDEDMGDVLIQLNDFYKVLTHGAYSRGTASHTHSQSSYISKESVEDIFHRLSPRAPEEVLLSELLLDPVALDYLDSLNSFTLPDLQIVLRPLSAETETD